MTSVKRTTATAGLIAFALMQFGCGQSNDHTRANGSGAGAPAGATAQVPVTASAGLQLPGGLPELTACANTTPPTLPPKWTATALMQTFGEHDVVLGKFTYDADEAAYRFSLSRAGASNFSDYLLTADKRLYALEGTYDAPTSCQYSLMLDMELPSQKLLSPVAQCVGEGPLNDVNREWWKDKAPTGDGANWYWFTADQDRSLFRTMPYKGIDTLGWVGAYAFSYFSEFDAQKDTNIGQLKALCGVAETGTEQPNTPVLTMQTALDQLLPPVEAPSLAQSAPAFVPEVQACGSVSARPPQWPNTLRATTLLTAVNFKYSPFPSLVRYDAALPGLRTDMYNPWSPTDQQWNLYSARLSRDAGYSAYFEGETFQSCKQDLPGPPQTDWMAVDGCECMAKLPPGTTLNPRASENLMVMMCPLTPTSADPENPQVFWTWYGEDSGSPQVFMQSDSSATAGTGLNLADYYAWEPNATIDSSIFAAPEGCPGPTPGGARLPLQCHNCHLPLNEAHRSDRAAQWHIPLPEKGF